MSTLWNLGMSVGVTVGRGVSVGGGSGVLTGLGVVVGGGRGAIVGGTGVARNPHESRNVTRRVKNKMRRIIPPILIGFNPGLTK
jgi:hypothetical protein